MSNVHLGAQFGARRLPAATSDIPASTAKILIGEGGYTRAPVDSVGRPARGPMTTTELTGRQHVDPRLLNLAALHVNEFFGLMTAYTGFERNEVPLTLANGETATITGNASNQNVRSRTRSGVVLEANISSRGAEAVRGFRTPQELHTFLNRLSMASGWADARGLPDR